MRVKSVLYASASVVLVSIYFLNGTTLQRQMPQEKPGEQALPKDPMSGRIVF